MKLKFRAEPKDFIIFGLFCLFVLYVVCIAITNLSSVANGNGFAGLNPLPAFDIKYLIKIIY